MAETKGSDVDRIEITPEMIEAGIDVCEEWIANFPYGSEANYFSSLVQNILVSAKRAQTLNGQKHQ